MNVGGGMTMTFGGSKSANAAAAKDSWTKILEFLDEKSQQSKKLEGSRGEQYDKDL